MSTDFLMMAEVAELLAPDLEYCEDPMEMATRVLTRLLQFMAHCESPGLGIIAPEQSSVQAARQFFVPIACRTNGSVKLSHLLEAANQLGRALRSVKWDSFVVLECPHGGRSAVATDHETGLSVRVIQSYLADVDQMRLRFDVAGVQAAPERVNLA